MKQLVPIVAIGLAAWFSACTWAKEPTAGEIAAAAAENSAPAASSALAEYVAKDDSSFAWKKRREGDYGTGRYVELTLTSQTWHGIAWKHQLFVYRPAEVRPGADALMLIGGGRWSDELEKADAAANDVPGTMALVAKLADDVKAPVAVLMHVPQQPMFGGMVEDQIIAFTFSKFFEDQSADWPLLLPMVKSAVRGMDAVQQFAEKEWDLNIDHFILTGASKRGWTTWLTSAVDPRVRGLAPMVIDLLNLGPQMKLQEISFGGYSDRIRDYTRRGLQRLISSPNGVKLQAIIDPYGYRDQLQQPKLIILGTNDPYWPVDALNMYWDGLLGEKYILYVPNGQHGLRDYPRLIGTMAALHRRVADNKPLPKLEWKFDEVDDSVVLTLQSDVEPESVTAWTAAADGRDFRQAAWTSEVVANGGGNGDGPVYVCRLARPEDGCAALFCEAKFNGQSMPFFLSTNIRVLESDRAAEE